MLCLHHLFSGNSRQECLSFYLSASIHCCFSFLGLWLLGLAGLRWALLLVHLSGVLGGRCLLLLSMHSGDHFLELLLSVPLCKDI